MTQPPTLLNSGASADVWDMGDGSVMKAFRRQSHTGTPPGAWEPHDFLTWFLCAVERVSYERIHAIPDLAPHVPEYFGPADASGLDFRQSPHGMPYVPDAAFRIEKLGGTETKIANVTALIQPEIEAVLERIREVAGRVNVWDASCFVPASRASFAVIDFAYPDDAFHLSEYLQTNGDLPAEIRERVKTFAGVA